jgi:hypothetical protein
LLFSDLASGNTELLASLASVLKKLSTPLAMFASFYQAVVKRVIQWRQQQAQDDKIAEAQKIIDRQREEHQLRHREEMRIRHQAGFLASNEKFKQKSKETIEGHQGPQLSVVLKGQA